MTEWTWRKEEAKAAMSEARDMLKRARDDMSRRRAEAIEARVAESLGTGKDLALWERYRYDLPHPRMELAFRDIAAGSTPQFSPCGFESSPCTVFRTSQVKVGKA